MICFFITSSVDLAVITEVRHWDKNFYEDVYNLDRYDHRVEVDELDESLCFAIVIDDGREYNLIGPDEETTTKWIQVMDKIVSAVRAIHQENEYYMYDKCYYLMKLRIQYIVTQVVEKAVQQSGQGQVRSAGF